MIKPRTPPGIMELLPREQIAFQRMLDVIRRNYERFGFLPVETPVFELSDGRLHPDSNAMVSSARRIFIRLVPCLF